MTTTDYTYYPSTATLYRTDNTAAKYYQTYRDYNNHYGYKARVYGGWIFFETETDFRTWKNQK